MIKLLRYWNQNKKKILITIAVIAFVIIIIQMINKMIQMQNERDKDKVAKNTIIASDITKPNQSIISDNKLTQKETEEKSNFIEQFVTKCNQHKVDEAYEMLTQDCKIELYPTKQIFISNYINQIFEQEVNYQLELWYSISNCHTYRITYNKGSLLQTGGQTSNSNYIDYITLIKQNGEYKLNINQFIGRTEINRKGENSGIEIQVNNKSIYVDYEIYHMTVQNNTQKTILLNDRKSVNHFKLIGKSNNIFTSVISEVPISSLTLNPQYRKTIDIKFNKIYMTESKVEAIQMENIYLDKEQYDTNQENADTITIRIGL